MPVHRRRFRIGSKDLDTECLPLLRALRRENTRLKGLVTEQQRLEAALRQSETWFRAMFENSPAGINILDMERKVLDINPAMCRMLGYAREELLGRTPAFVTHPDDVPRSAQKFNELRSGQQASNWDERRYIRKNGEEFWAQVTVSVVRDQEGRPLYLIGMAIDVTEQHRMLAELQDAHERYRRELEQAVAERTEELNQANELLRAKAAEDAVIAERTRLARDLHDAVTQTLFSTAMIADVLPRLWERHPEEGRRRLEEVRQLTRGALAEMRTLLVELRPNALVEVPLPTLLRQLTDAMIGRARIDVQLTVQGERQLPPDVQVGFYRIAQEALNNIAKHARASHVFITLHAGETVRLTIADDGCGFDPSQVASDHLGVKIMCERADAIGSQISLESVPGGGTQISLLWPKNP